MTMKSDTAAELKSYLERVERIEAERKEMGDEIRAIYAEAKARGFVPKAIREMVKRRKKDAAELAEDEAILDTYMHAAGMTAENPLFAAVSAMSVDTLAREQVLDTFKLLIPINGEIIARVGGAPMRLWRTEGGIAYAAEYVEAKAAPAEKPGKGLRTPGTVLTMVPKDHIKAAADAAERRSKATKLPGDVDADSETDETVE
jgi:uncharacterized protein (UPF0335 family)